MPDSTSIFLPVVAVVLASSQGGPPPAKVATAPVVERAFTTTLRVLGEAEAIRDARLGLEVDGLVQKIHVDEGTRVEAGQVLLELKTEQREIRKRRAEAELALAAEQLAEYEAGSRPEDVREAEEAVVEARELSEEADRELERVEGLRKTNVAPEKDLTQARSRALAARAVLRSRQANFAKVKAGPRVEVIARAKSQVAIRKAELAEIVDAIAKAKLAAPFAGVITERSVEIGGYGRAGDPVLSLVQMHPIRVVLAVPEHSIARVRPGMAARIRFDAMPGRTIDGKIEAVVPRADALARTFPVKVLLNNADFRILPGMAARAEIELDGGPPALAVPSDAVVRGPFGSIVYAVRDGKAVQVRVRTGRSAGVLVEVSGELIAKDRVVTRGNETLRPGSPVVVVEAPETGKDDNREGGR